MKWVTKNAACLDRLPSGMNCDANNVMETWGNVLYLLVVLCPVVLLAEMPEVGPFYGVNRLALLQQTLEVFLDI